jgi:hypothetical protein
MELCLKLIKINVSTLRYEPHAKYTFIIFVFHG